LLSVLRLALLPALARFAEPLAPLFLGISWTRGDCPNCGQIGTLAESRGLEQRRFLRCGLCAGEWPGDRLRCSFCGETDPQALHYRFVEGDRDRHRLALCDRCGGGLKVVSTLMPLSPPGMLVAELDTVHLDLI
jgi:FdhE protein